MSDDELIIRYISSGTVRIRLAIGVLALWLLSMLTVSVGHAESDHNIRVSLFIDQRGTVPSVSVSAPQGVAVFDGQDQLLVETPSDEPIRFSLLGFRLRSSSFPDINTAADVKKRLEAAVGKADIIVMRTGTETSYTVYAGAFTSETEALKAAGGVSDSVGVAGPYHWEAGTYPTESEAGKLKHDLQAAGIPAAVVIRATAERGAVYAVWAGEAANMAGLESLQAQIAAVRPDISLKVADLDESALLERTEWNETYGRELAHYSLSGTSPVRIESRGGYIRLDERSNRTYRGHLELSEYRGRLAVINVLPLEQYLYAVVSAEMGGGWPMEALKAQAVSARTFALKQGMKYEIAHISDTTFDQAYYGVASEAEDAIQAVEATRGETIRDASGQLITPFYSSNAGGMTAAASEVWTEDVHYAAPVPSPDDVAEQGRLHWDRIVLPDGTIGYVRTDFTRDTGETNDAGLPILEATGDGVNVRPAPYVNNTDNAPIGQISIGDRLILLESRIESNPYRWVRGPFDASVLERSIRAVTHMDLAPLTELAVSRRGQSGRVTEMTANGAVISVSTPDRYRTAMNGLPSTRFDVEQTAVYQILAARNQLSKRTSGRAPYVIGANDALLEGAEEMIVLGSGGTTRVITKSPAFRFIGMGFGHGVGMSQWGARELASFMNYDYKEILEYYYRDITISGEG